MKGVHLHELPFGYSHCRLIKNEVDIPIDYEFIDANEKFAEVTGLEYSDIIGERAKYLFGAENVKREQLNLYKDISENSKDKKYVVEEYREIKGKWYKVYMFSEKSGYFTAFFIDETRERRAQEDAEQFFKVNMGLLCIVRTSDGEILRANSEWEELLGYKLNEIEGKSFFEFIHKEDIGVALEAVEKIKNGESISNFINRYRCSNGNYKYFKWRVYPKEEIVYASAIDVTEEKLKESELIKQNQLQNLLMSFSLKYINIPVSEIENGIKEALITVARFVNADRSYIFEYNFEKRTISNSYEWCGDCISSHIEEMQNIPIEYAEVWLEKHLKGEPVLFENINEISDERAYKILKEQNIKSIITLPMIFEGHCAGFIGFDWVNVYHKFTLEEKKLLLVLAQILVNINNRKIMEEKLKEDKINAEKANRAKSEFLSDISHEIRTPMNAIIGFTDIMFDEESDEEKKEMLETIKISGKNLVNLINDILEISKIEAGKMKRYEEELSIKELMGEIDKLLKNSAIQKGLDFVFEISKEVPEFVTGDSLKLKQILTNIIGNAIKFTETGYIKSSVKFLKNEKEKIYLRFIVEDSGAGINEEKKRHIFEKFEQGENFLNKKYEGSGLGLALVKRLTDFLDGEIDIISEIGNGTKVILDIPFKTKMEEEEKINKTLKDEKTRDLKIIMAEDNPANQKVAEIYLRKLNQNVKIVENGQRLIEELEKESYDLILLDIQMPVLNGIEALKIIRNSDKWKKIPVVGISAFGMLEDVEKAVKIGMDDYILKPIQKEEFYEKIRKWM